MPARVQVRAVIWVGDQVVVHHVNQRGALHVTLPGGRVNDRESVVDALKREVLEEIGIEVTVGDLTFAAEVLSGARRQDVELVFAARPATEAPRTSLELVDPKDPRFKALRRFSTITAAPLATAVPANDAVAAWWLPPPVVA
jgi:ADP-ribose pyrophosphatase YjhB (NUDIX family)